MFHALSVHFACGFLVWLDMAFNHVKFPGSHRIVLIFVLLAYLANNIFWTLTTKPIYPPITYKDAKTFVLIGVALALSLAGFELGRYLYRRKAALIEGSYKEISQDKALDDRQM